MEIYVMRHGETNANKEGIFQGWADGELDQFGLDLAEYTGQGMRGLKFDAAFSSPLQRAYKTAELVLRESGNTCAITKDDRLKEQYCGEWEDQKFLPEESTIDQTLCQEFFTNPGREFRAPGGETVQQLMDRTQDFLKELAKKDYNRVLVAMHAGSMRAMLNFLYDDPTDFWHGMVPYNCAVNILNVKDGKIRLVEEDKIFYDPKYLINRYSEVQ